MLADKLRLKYEEVKREVNDKKLPNEGKDMYLIGWLDCILYVLREEKND